MRLATWNINGIRARLDYLLLWLREHQPDVVGLQELKVEDELFPHDALAEVGYHAATHGQKSWNGVAILTKTPAEVTQVGLPTQADQGARLLTARVGDVEMTTVYCPNGKNVGHPDFARKLEWFDALAAHVEATFDPERPFVLCGDFNIVPAGIDSWNEKRLTGSIFHTDDERSRFQRFLDAGLRDVFREQHPDEPGFTWWDYRAGAFHKKQGLRIDFVLASAPIANRVEDAVSQRSWRKKKEGLISSDHAPVVVDLR